MKRVFFIAFTTFLLSSCTQNTLQKSVHVTVQDTIHIGILPLNSINLELVSFSAREIEQFYGVKTEILPGQSLPDSLRNPYPQRYNANRIIAYLQKTKPSRFDYILGITSERIATKKGKYKEWGILGLGQNPGPCCIVSTANMGGNVSLLKERLSKTCLHEMGHNFGLPHCTYGDSLCLMRDANGTVKTIDSEKKHLCTLCKNYLHSKGFHITADSLIN